MKTTIAAYILLESLLRNKILAGRIEPGDRLPNEDDLAAKFGVSRTTVRTALSHLENEKLIIRKPAKGTFVAEEIPEMKKFLLSSTPQEMYLYERQYEAITLGIETKKIQETRYPRDVGSFFNAGSDETIGIVERVRLLKGVPICYVENFLSPDFLRYLSPHELEKKSLLRTLSGKVDLDLGPSEMYFESIPADPDLAEILDIQVFSPLILIQMYYRYTSKAPFQGVNYLMRSDHFKFKLEFDARQVLACFDESVDDQTTM